MPDSNNLGAVIEPAAVSFAPSHYLRGFGPQPSEEVSGTVKAMNNDQSPHVAHFRKVRRAKNSEDFETWEEDEKANTINCFDQGDIRSTDVVVHAFKIRGGSEVETGEQGGTPGKKAGKGYLGQDEKAFTIGTSQDQQIMQPIALDTYNQTINHETTQTIRANTSTEHIGAVIVPKAAAFSVAKGAQSRTIGYREENAPTLVADTGNSHAVMHPIPVLAGEHPQKGVSIDVCPTLPAAMGMGGGHTPLVPQPVQICFNDANGKRADRPNGGCYITENPQTSPTVTCAENDLKVLQPIAVHQVSPTITAKMQGMSGWAPYNETEHLVPVAQPIPILAGEHPQKGVSIDVCPTLPAAMGMGGGHTPLVPHPVAYSFDSLASNSMKSSNPHSGCRAVETSKTIDTSIPEPSKNQGGIAIAQPKYYESHPNDSRVTGPHDVGNTVSARYGTGGGNTPIVVQPTISFSPSHFNRGFGQTPLEEVCGTLKSSQSDQSIHIAQPIALAENTIGRQPMNGGNGNGFTEDGPMYTLNATGVHGVAQPIAVDWRTTQVDVEKTGTLKTDLAKMSGPCIAFDAYNQTINEKTTQTIGSSASDANHVGAVLQPIQISFNDANGTRADRPNGGCYIIENPQSSPALTLADSPVKVLQPTIIDRAAFNQGENAQYEPRIEEGQTMSSLVAKGPHAVQHTMAIRRLTPRECERLQGFPDDWTLIPYRNKPADQCPDGPRYKACGNSMAVPMMRWIGQRIKLIDTIIN